MILLDYLDKTIRVAPYVAPGVVRGPKMILTVIKFCDGTSCLDPSILGRSEEYAKACGSWLRDFHKASKQFAIDCPEVHKEYQTYE
jgi:hypothetical protein